MSLIRNICRNNPETGVLSDRFSIGWAHYLVSKHQYIYGWVERDNEDVRHKETKRNYDVVNDNIDKYGIAINYIKDNKRFINPKKVCIWGQSVGAFVAVSTLATNEGLMCAVLVSPVINWRLMGIQ